MTVSQENDMKKDQELKGYMNVIIKCDENAMEWI